MSKLKIIFQKIFKFLIFVLIIVVPIIIVMSVMGTMAQEKRKKEFIQNFSLPELYSKEDVDRIIERMRQTNEFAFYFYALRPEQIEMARQEVFQILDQNRTKEMLIQTMMTQIEPTSKAAVLFSSLEYPEDFSQDMSKYPKFKEILEQFLYEDFKLAILGLCYKATYQITFMFNWDKATRSAAVKAHKLISSAKVYEQTK